MSEPLTIPRICATCEHWRFEAGYGEYSDACDAQVWCAKDHWRLENHEDTQEDYRKKQLTALICPDYECVEAVDVGTMDERGQAMGAYPPYVPLSERRPVSAWSETIARPERTLWRVEYAKGYAETIEAPTAAVAARGDWVRIYSLPEWAEATNERAGEALAGGIVRIATATSAFTLERSEEASVGTVFVVQVDGVREARPRLADALWLAVEKLEPREPALIAPPQSSQPASPDDATPI